MKINRRANVPIIILVIGVLAICTLALLSFVRSDFEIKDSLKGVSEVRDLAFEIEMNSYEGEDSHEIFRERESSFGSFSNQRVIFRVDYFGD